jgi:uncharacterized repeat protein (TIGR04138 family)
VFELQLANELLDRIRAIDGRYHERAYLFVLAALEYCQVRRPARGHISGEELAWACRDLAREQFGLTSRTVLSHWGIRSTADLGTIVYVLIDVGLLMPRDEDRIEDFEAVYDFEEVFEVEYPWAGVSRTGGSV